MTLPDKVSEYSWQELSLHLIPRMAKLLKYVSVVVVDILYCDPDQSIDLYGSFLAANYLLKLVFKPFSVLVPLYE